MLTQQKLVITEQFVGPPAYGNGGFVVGHMARALSGGDVIGAGAVEVTLRAPLPLDVALGFRFDSKDGVSLNHGAQVLATARRSALELDVPALPQTQILPAREGMSLSLKPGVHATLGERIGVHPICFCCGAERGEGDGLRVFPVPLEGREDVGALWIPDEAFADAEGLIGPEIIAAAIDCPGAFAFLEAGVRAGLLGRMTVEFFRPLRAGRPAQILGWKIGTDGRKMLAGTALFDESGALVAKASQVWFGFV